ncbi:MAG: HAD family phosphatase [Holdemanella sp.]|nr:HAD family phosphatase [Holdemanella sp.]
MKKAVVFDMDGLMFDTETDYMNALNQYFKENGYPLIEKDVYSTVCGMGDEPYYEMIDRHCRKKMNHEEIMDYVQKTRWNWMYTKGVPVKKGLYTLLDYLKKNGYILVVGSSTDRKTVEKLLRMAEIYESFDYLVCGDMVQNRKPAPDIFLKACEITGFQKTEMLILEDAMAGIEAACAACMDVICVPDLVKPDEKHYKMAYKVVENLENVIDILENEKNNL